MNPRLSANPAAWWSTRSSLRSFTARISICACFIASTASIAGAHTPAEAMTQAAQRFLASLNDQQRAQAQFEFTDQERLNWQFIPMERAGISLKVMKPNQQHLAVALLNSALSHAGTSKALTIMSLEQILHEMEDNSPRRDPQLYHVFIFGTPSNDSTWGWRVEGHHLSVSFTIVDGQQVVSTPSFLGANPAHVKSGPQKGLRALAAEEDLARALLNSLDDQQRSVAIISAEAPADIINGPGRVASALEPVGLPASQLNPEQRKHLMAVVREYVFNLRPELATADMAKIRKAGVRKITFAWAGSTEPGQGHYYRIQGPSFILEYDNTQNDANHIHCVWRDFENDFGEDLLQKHYAEDPHGE